MTIPLENAKKGLKIEGDFLNKERFSTPKGLPSSVIYTLACIAWKSNRILTTRTL